MKTIATEKLPVKMWTDDIEENAMKQIINLANLPFAFKHIAIMPDSHSGYGMPIGGVLATKNVIIPNAVGVDIGCGMSAIKTSLSDIAIDDIKLVMGEIRKVIPVGFNHREVSNEILMPERKTKMEIVDRQYMSACKQLGSLGGGNHFIEIQRGGDGFIWVMIHSGSRNLGKQVCDYYNKLATQLNEKWFSSVPSEYELSFLPMDTIEAQQYYNEMNYCLEFAKANRFLMMRDVQEIFYNKLNAVATETIDIHHNYATFENHFGKNVIIHRKGATSAKDGQHGIIPGSQGTKSYIVRGKGNPDSFMSCSHGAGRKMGRKQAQRELKLDEEIDRLNKQNIVHSIRHINDLDEASGAYKDIETVMNNQMDLVDIIVELTPLGVIKG